MRLVSAALFPGSSPWRKFGSRKGQAHYPGAYWSAVAGGHVPYESRLELSFLLFADREPGARAVYAQPFRLVAAVGGRIRRHVPDFLVEDGDGGLTVVDVKPRRRLGDEKVKFTFGWTAGLAGSLGWGFGVFSEPEPGVLANVRFLSGYRRVRQFDPAVLEKTLSLAGCWTGLRWTCRSMNPVRRRDTILIRPLRRCGRHFKSGSDLMASWK